MAKRSKTKSRVRTNRVLLAKIGERFEPKPQKRKKRDIRSFIPEDPKKIRAKIRKYERLLAKEKSEFGIYSDGYGKRLLLGPLYLFLGDLDAALTHFSWFELEFPDDGEPGQLLCWTLVLLRSGHIQAARNKLQKTALSNAYLIPHLLGEKTIGAMKPDLCGDDWPEYVGMMPPEYFEIWTDEEKAWVLGESGHDWRLTRL